CLSSFSFQWEVSSLTSTSPSSTRSPTIEFQSRFAA
ncbi:unnamed protein product, partial [Brassica oleracea var. botrytis]